MPPDHTTVEEVYSHEKGVQVLVKNRSNHLNEARKETRGRYMAEFNGTQPKRIGLGGKMEDIYPKSWGGIMEVLRSLHRARTVGVSQRPITSFVNREVHVHVYTGAGGAAVGVGSPRRRRRFGTTMQE